MRLVRLYENTSSDKSTIDSTHKATYEIKQVNSGGFGSDDKEWKIIIDPGIKDKLSGPDDYTELGSKYLSYIRKNVGTHIYEKLYSDGTVGVSLDSRAAKSKSKNSDVARLLVKLTDQFKSGSTDEIDYYSTNVNSKYEYDSYLSPEEERGYDVGHAYEYKGNRVAVLSDRGSSLAVAVEIISSDGDTYVSELSNTTKGYKLADSIVDDLKNGKSIEEIANRKSLELLDKN